MQKPNILFIAIDDLRPFLGCFGDPNAHTPNIDALAERGVRFTNAMCTAPSCGPSRAAIFTGQYPTTTGIYGFQDWTGRELFADSVTLPEYLRQNGYKTFTSGKLHHNSTNAYSKTQEAVDENLKRDEPSIFTMVPRADREWDETNLEVISHTPYNHAPVREDCINWSGEENPTNDKFLSGPSDDPVMACQDGETVRYALRKLDEQHDEPFFLGVGIVRPHLPFIAPRRYFEHYRLDSLELPPVKIDDLADKPWAARSNARVHDDIEIRSHENGRARVIQAYYACVSFVDDMVGRVVNALDDSRYRDNTVIVFWSDHGWHLGEKRSWRKFTLWEESARTPMIVVDPRSREAAGSECARPVALIDLFPTLAEMSGIPVPEWCDGRSFAPLVTEPRTDWPHPALTIQGKGNYSVRDEEWRYTRYFDGSEELYNHREDPYEWTNLAEDPAHVGVKARLGESLPETAATTVLPRGLSNWHDEEKNDMEGFVRQWNDWLKRCDPPLL
jgi:arylsulfatase A-like enzyme